MSNFSTEIWTRGLTSNPQPGRRELVMAANKTSKKSGGFVISTKKSTQGSSNNSSVFHPEDSGAESGGDSDTDQPKRNLEAHRSALPQIRPMGTSSTPTTNSPSTPKKSGILYKIFHPNDEANGIFGSSRRSVHSSEEESDTDICTSSENEAEKCSGHVSSLPRVRPSDSESKRPQIFRKSSVSSHGSSDDDSDGDSDDQKSTRRTRGSIFRDLMKINRSSSQSDIDSDEENGTNKILKGLSLNHNKKYQSQSSSSLIAPNVNGKSIDNSDFSNHSPAGFSSELQRTNSEQSLSEKYGKKEEILGKGAHAVVRLCQPVNSDKKYAIKEFRKRKNSESQVKEYVKKLVAEFCISSTLEHENVVRTVDLIKDDI
ncbi:serine/threonine-protein kinase HAL4/sat4 [Nowakowskiella sp. JEL0078]|nr:serine/threonine-protein kinase HAL4/sat4 [Nowakowskiella sp. JEL0078]